MDIKNVYLFLSILFGLFTPFIGIRSILNKVYRPHRTTRLIYLIVTALFVGTLTDNGDKIGIFLAWIQFGSCLIIFILSLRFGIGGSNKVDFIVFVLSMVTLLIWKTTDDPVLALYMSIGTDLIGSSPTIIKSIKLPFTEDPKFYASDTIAGFFNLTSQRSYNLYDLAFPGYIFFVNLFVLLIIMNRRKVISKK